MSINDGLVILVIGYEEFWVKQFFNDLVDNVRNSDCSCNIDYVDRIVSVGRVCVKARCTPNVRYVSGERCNTVLVQDGFQLRTSYEDFAKYANRGEWFDIRIISDFADWKEHRGRKVNKSTWEDVTLVDRDLVFDTSVIEAALLEYGA